jgi:hypothetical protein
MIRMFKMTKVCSLILRIGKNPVWSWMYPVTIGKRLGRWVKYSSMLWIAWMIPKAKYKEGLLEGCIFVSNPTASFPAHLRSRMSPLRGRQMWRGSRKGRPQWAAPTNDPIDHYLIFYSISFGQPCWLTPEGRPKQSIWQILNLFPESPLLFEWRFYSKRSFSFQSAAMPSSRPF